MAKDPSPLEQALRSAHSVSKINIFRNKARGGWEAAVSRDGSPSTFSVGVSDDPVEALLKALNSTPAPAKSPVAVEPPVKPVEPILKGGIFG